MILSSKRRTYLTCRVAREALLGAALAASTTGAAYAVPVDAVPLERPGTHIVTAPEVSPDVSGATDMPPAGLPASPLLPQEPQDVPKLGAPALRAAEPAILRVAFDPDDAVLSPQALGQVKTFAAAFKQRGGRVTLKAYAGTAGDVSTNARRLSLKRVLAVRETLLAQGISAERLNVQALGGARDAGPLDRVDIVRAGG
ncbi:OmpA family protein [Parvibaculum sp.]|uniref:OmpA family protein n=1 Tax=Parvibaculum sp. TaxID=2024848 RepID=UPI002D7FEE61|nr:OmpA family protein [Parvibaculum sp.]